MIKLDISDYCNDCPEFDAEIHTFYALDRTVEIRIVCSNAEKCNLIKKHLESAMERKDENSNAEGS